VIIQEAIKLLLLESEIKQSEDRKVTIEDASTTVGFLAYHPLAIAQAGAYIHMRGLSLQNFSVEYNRRHEEILKDTTPHMTEYRKRLRESNKEIPISVFTTFELSYQQLLTSEESKNLPGILTSLAFFAPRGISLSLFEAYCQIKDADRANEGLKCYSNSAAVSDIFMVAILDSCIRHGHLDHHPFYEAFKGLSQLSLIEISTHNGEDGERHVSLHPLIRDWLRWRTPKVLWGETSSFVAMCVFAVLITTPYSDDNYRDLTFATRHELVAHINEFTTNIKDFSGPEPLYDKGAPSDEFGDLLEYSGLYNLSISWFRRSLKLRQEQFGVEDNRTLLVMNRFGEALSRDGRYQESEELYRKFYD
jgi:hypothetical protein